MQGLKLPGTRLQLGVGRVARFRGSSDLTKSLASAAKETWSPDTLPASLSENVPEGGGGRAEPAGFCLRWNISHRGFLRRLFGI